MMNLQDKGKIFYVHAKKAYRWSRGTIPLILTSELDGSG